MFGESFETAWEARFGDAPNLAVEELAPLLRHRSIRKYADHPVPTEVIEVLIGCAQSASTSSGLQAYSFVSVQEPERRAAIAKLCADQRQVHEAPWFFAVIADLARAAEIAQEVGSGGEGLDYTEFLLIACVDAALAAERMMCAAETVGLGGCYIGALRNHPQAVADLLGLPDGTFGIFGLCLGYPAEDVRAEVKPRLPLASVWHQERYAPFEGRAEYDARMGDFYRSQGMNPDVTWSMRTARRTGEGQLSGREVLQEFLRARGFGRR
jgi:nitroreductase